MSAKYDRQIDILNILMRGGRKTIYDIACKTGVCTHTIKRDLADLAYHFPIFTYAGRGGGVELNACFIMNSCMLRREEVLLIKYCLERLACSDDDMAMAAKNCLSKIFHTECS